MKPIRTLVQVKNQAVRVSFKVLTRTEHVRVKAKGKLTLRVARYSEKLFTCFPHEDMKGGGRTCQGSTPQQAFANAVKHYW